MKKAISFDLWGTLISGNPEFKDEQAKLVMSYDNRYTPESWLLAKNQIKAFNDTVIGTTGSHMDRRTIYQLLLPTLSNNELLEFISKSDELFFKYPPTIKSDTLTVLASLRASGYECYLSSNTMFVYGEVLYNSVVKQLGFERKDCHFSDEVGYSKPNILMFFFPIKPTFHVGDNCNTDGTCVAHGIRYLEVSKTVSLTEVFSKEGIFINELV